MSESNCIITSAPGKMIILGEHSVVYGKPAVALAIDRRFYCKVQKSQELSVNGYRATPGSHPHIRSILHDNGVGAVSINAATNIPASSGLGSSAALSSSFSLALRKLHGKPTDERSVIEDAFSAEWFAQGRASPMDASACTHGKGIAINSPDGVGRPLCDISRAGNTWKIKEMDVPDMTFVVGYTGVYAPTGPIVEKVRKFKERNRFASDTIDEIGLITLLGINAIRRNDKEDLGDLMTRNHKLLSILGVSCNELNKLVNASLPHSYGAKLTGSGGGGSMIALTDDPDAVVEAIRLHGGTPMVVHTENEGVRTELDAPSIGEFPLDEALEKQSGQ